MPKVARPKTACLFISRAGRDRDVASRVDRALRSAGYVTFVQDNDFGHSSFMARMAEAFKMVDQGGTVITLLSAAYQASEHCLKEARYPLVDDPNNLSERLIVLRIEECEPSDFLKDIRYVDLVPHLNDDAALARVVLGAVDPSRYPEQAQFAAAYERRRQIVHYEIHENAKFAGRSEDLVRLTQALWGASAEAAQGQATSVAALTGMAGVGKSILAREYAWRNRERYHGLWWVRAETKEALLDDLSELSARLRTSGGGDREKVARTALDALWQAKTDQPWLLIYDNAEMPAAIEDLTPRGGAHVIVTSRWPRWDGAAEVPVDVFPQDIAVQYLMTRARRQDREGASRLAVALGCLPLALDQAGSYCAGAHWTFDEYGKALGELIRRKPRKGSSAGQYPDSVYATFNLALDRVIAGDETHGVTAIPEAELLLGILAHFDPDRFPLDLITPDILSDIEKGDAAAALQEASLLQVGRFEDGRPHASMHRLVKLVTLARLREDKNRLAMALLKAVHVVVAEDLRQQEKRPDDWIATARSQIQQAQAISQKGDQGTETPDSIDPESERQFRELVTSFSQLVADEANRVLAVARLLSPLHVHVMESLEGDDGLSVAVALEMISRFLIVTRRFDDADAALRRAIAIRQRHLGPDHSDTQATAQMLQNLALRRAAATSKPAAKAAKERETERLSPSAQLGPTSSTRNPGLWARLFRRTT